MPPDPTVSVPPPQHRDTASIDIGHVAPDFDDRKFFNALVIRPQFRITVRLGNIEELFPNEPNTPEGRMERMQTLGLFYFPLIHTRRNDAFAVCWDHFKTKILNGANDSQADGSINSQLENRIVDGGVLPAPAAEGSDPQESNFIKIRLPGGYTFLTAGWGLNVNNDAVYGSLFNVYQDLYQAESRFFTENPVLGKIPLVAKVEKRADDSGQWQPAEGVAVYFQLIPPYDLPPFDPNRPTTAQLNRPPLRDSTAGPPAVATGAGPKKLTDSEEARIPPIPTDPQSGNGPSDRGGKRGNAVEGNIFETASRAGFNEAHPTRNLPHKPYPVAQAVAPVGTDHMHAVKALTNEDGEAGVIFMPSHAGGDRYRLRAYVGPDTLDSGGAGSGGVRVDTGTLVVWRNIRISRYVRQPAGNPEPSQLLAQANTAPYNLADANAYLQPVGVVNNATPPVNVGLPTADFSANFMANVGSGGVYDRIIPQFARAFGEMELDRTVQVPEVLSQADWQAARQQGVNDAVAGMNALRFDGNPNRYNLNILFCMEAGSPITVNNAVCNLPMRTREAYNAMLAAGHPQRMRVVAGGGAHPTDIANITSLFWSYLMPGFLRSLTRNGYLPGLTVIQGAGGATWQLFGNHLPGNSGVAYEYRGCYVWFGNAIYPSQLSYDFNSNVCHELGHNLYRNHGPGNPTASDIAAAEHDPVADDTCVMSYRRCEGQFCGKCLFAFRGWNITGMTQV